MSLFNYDNISWNLPLLFCHDELIFAISDVLKEFKNIKKPTFYAYGSVSTPWAGGRHSTVNFFDTKFLEKYLNKVIDAGFIPSFTFTKPYISKNDLNDKISNWILDYGTELGCDFLVASEHLYNHIKERNPNTKVSASILQGKMEFHNPAKKQKHKEDSELNFYNERLEKYNKVVVRPEYVYERLEKDLDKIKDITKLEVHVNETCIPNCPKAVKCYTSMDKYLRSEKFIEDDLCARDDFLRRKDIKTNFSFIQIMSKDRIDHLVNDIGVKHLKIQGRHYSSTYLYNLVLYYIFNETGNFQTIRPYIVEKAKEYRTNMEILPYEQKMVIKQTSL